MPNFIIRVLLIVLFSSYFSLSFTQSRFTLSGTVSEFGSSEPILSANITIYRDSLKTGGILRGSATNKFGFYSVPDLNIGKYFVVVTSIGYETLKKNIFLDGKQKVTRIDFVLEKKTITLGEIVIQDKKFNDFTQNVGSIEVNPEVVKRLPSFGGEADIYKALQLLPGVASATEISTGLYVRGGSADQNLTLIDGVNVYNPSHLGGFASTFNADAINSITLIKGAYPAEFGGRLSSVLDLTMREGSKEDFHVTGGLNSLSGRITLEGPIDTNASFILSGRKLFLDWILPSFPKLDYIPRYGFYDLNGKISYTMSKNDKLFISGFISHDNISDPPNNKDIGYGISWSNATGNLTWTNITSSSMFSNTSLMYTNYKFTTLIKDKQPSKTPLDFYTSSIINDILLKREMQFFAAENHSIKTGAEVAYHMFSTTTSDLFIKDLEYRPFYGKEINSLEGSFYIQDDWKISDFIKLNPGVRFSYFQKAGFFAAEPRLSLTWFLLDRLTLRSSVALAHQTLHMLNRNDIFLPTDLWYPSTELIKPSRSIQGSAGLETVSADKTFLFTVEGYYKDLKDLYEYKENADFSFNTDLEQQMTKGVGYAYGVELFLNKRAGDFNGWIGYTLAWTKRYFEMLNAGKVYYPRYDKRHDISIVLNYDISSHFNASATWQYGTGQAFALPVNQYSIVNPSVPNGTKSSSYYEFSGRDDFRLPPFHKLDLSFNYNTTWFGKETLIALNIYNAYNRYNAFTKYIGYKTDPVTKEKIPVLKQFTLYPFLPSLGVNIKF